NGAVRTLPCQNARPYREGDEGVPVEVLPDLELGTTHQCVQTTEWVGCLDSQVSRGDVHHVGTQRSGSLALQLVHQNAERDGAQSLRGGRAHGSHYSATFVSAG